MNIRKTYVTVALVSGLVLGASACQRGPEVVTGRYEPFDAATAALGAPYGLAHADINEIRAGAAFGPASFADIDAIWTADLAAVVSAAVAGHSFVSEGAGLGAALAADVEAALAAGAAGNNPSARGQVIDKTLQRFFVERMAAGLWAGDEAGWDEAYSWYGRSFDGATSAMVAGTAARRDTNFGTDYNDRIWNAFIDGRNAFVTDEAAGVESARDEIDLLLMEVFALSAQRELREMEDAAVVADLDAHEEKLLEGVIFWETIRGHAALLDPATAAMVDAALEAAIPDDPASIDGTAVADTILALYGITL